MAGTPRGQSQSQLAQPMGRAGVLPAPRIGLTPHPDGNDASPMRRDPRFGRSPGVYPQFVFGVFALEPGEVQLPNLNLCYIPFNVILSDFFFNTNGITGTLQDSSAAPTIYGTVSGAIYTRADMTGADANNFGTCYHSTPRALGPFGPPVAQWQQGMTLQLAGYGGAQTWPTSTPLIFTIVWSPGYDAGY